MAIEASQAPRLESTHKPIKLGIKEAISTKTEAVRIRVANKISTWLGKNKQEIPKDDPSNILREIVEEANDPLTSPQLSPLSNEQFKTIEPIIFAEDDSQPIIEGKLDEQLPKLEVKPTTSEAVVQPMKVVKRTQIPGSTENLAFVEVIVPSATDGEDQTVRYISKEPSAFRPPVLDSERADTFIAIWQNLKDAGLPVVPEVIKVSDTEVYMTDLTADGSGLYDKYLVLNPSKHFSIPTNSVFAQINTEEVFTKADEIFQIANEKNITLPNDDPLSLIVHPDGSWQLLIIDLGHTNFNSRWREEVNTKCLSNFKNSITYLQDSIKDIVASF